MALGIVAHLAWQGCSSAGTPADLTVDIEVIESAGAGFRVDFAIVNRGDDAAADAKGVRPVADRSGGRARRNRL